MKDVNNLFITVKFKNVRQSVALSNFSESKGIENCDTAQAFNPIVMADFPYRLVGFAPQTACPHVQDGEERVGRKGTKIKHFLIFIYRIVNRYCTKRA